VVGDALLGHHPQHFARLHHGGAVEKAPLGHQRQTGHQTQRKPGRPRGKVQQRVARRI